MYVIMLDIEKLLVVGKEKSRVTFMDIKSFRLSTLSTNLL